MRSKAEFSGVMALSAFDLFCMFYAFLFQFGFAVCFSNARVEAIVLAERGGSALSGGSLRRSQQITENGFSINAARRFEPRIDRASVATFGASAA